MVKRIFFLLVTLTALTANAFAASRVVVIPLNTSKPTLAEGVTYACTASINGGLASSSDCQFDVIPAGKNFVAEFVSGQIYVPSGQEVFGNLRFSYPGGGGPRHSLIMSKAFTYGGFDLFIVSQSIAFYATEGENLGIQLSRSSTTGAASGLFWLTGYLVPKN